MRLIDADKLPKYTGYALSASDVAIAVENAPAVDAVPVVHGWWEIYQAIGSFCLNGDFNVLSWRCSACGGISTLYSKFCPNCGAKMGGGAEDAADT